MRGKRAKQLRELVGSQDQNIFLQVRNYYVDLTEKMDDVGVYRAAKRLYNMNKLKGVTNAKCKS